MSMEKRIFNKLKKGLNPLKIEVINESHMHAGHRSSPGTGESHFRVFVISELFREMSRVARHRMVNDLVSEELKEGIHAFSLSAYAPGEVSSFDDRS